MDITRNDENNENISEDVLGHRKSTRATSTDIEADNKSFSDSEERTYIPEVTYSSTSPASRMDITRNDENNENISEDVLGHRKSTRATSTDIEADNKSFRVNVGTMVLVAVVVNLLMSLTVQPFIVDEATMKSQQEKVKKRISELVDEKQNILNEQLERIEYDMKTQLTDSERILTEKVVEVEEKFKKLSVDLEQVLENKESIDKTLKDQYTVLSVIRENTFNKAAGIFAIMLLFMLVIILFILVCGKQMNKRTDAAIPRLPNVNSNIAAANTNQANAITVVSFDDETQNQHRQLMQAITTQLNTRLNALPIRFHVIYRHDDIASIPPSKLSFMFADFTERHVIIEQPGLGLGDLKRKTYEKICALQSDLVIIYVKDPGSRRINRRFNPNIDCVTSQPELRVVNDRHRFFSVYDNFAGHQLQSLVEIIEETFAD